MSIHRAGFLFLGVIVFCTAVTMHGQIAGTWTGTMDVVEECGGSQQTFSSPATLAVIQSGTSLFGNLTIEAERDLQEDCVFGQPFAVTLPVTGLVSGSSIAGEIVVPEGSVQFSGTVSGTGMTFSIAGDEETRTFGFARTNANPPDSSLLGTYGGSYTEVLIPCQKLPAITYSGSLSGTLSHLGNSIVGVLFVTNLKYDHEEPDGRCTVMEDPHPLPVIFTGTISGTRIDGFFLEGDGTPFTATISGSTINGSSEGEFPGESFTFTLTRTSSTLQPVVTSFTVDPERIIAGSASVLSWSAVFVSSVSIDNGVGALPASGSITVRPPVTTTYTLTAPGVAGGAVTAATTVTVIANARRRRAVRH